MAKVGRVCTYCRKTKYERPCEHCGRPKPTYSHHDSKRENSHKRGYTRKWRKFRERLIKHAITSGEWDGCCDLCGRSITGMIHADHIQPVKDSSDPLFYDRTNIQFLHPACHSQKTREDAQSGQTRKRG